MNISIERIYDVASDQTGIRILVDRLWPRGILKDKARIDRWEKEIAPTKELRKWFNHEEVKWAEFKKRYFSELKSKETLVNELIEIAYKNPLILVYSAKDKLHNQASALKEYLLDHIIFRKI